MMKPPQITVPDELTDPHELVVASLPLLRQAKELREDLLERETCLSITVQTHALVSRAIRVMDTLLKALEACGYSIEVTPPRPGHRDPDGRRSIEPSATLARIGETVIRFGIHEGSDRVPTTPARRRAIFDTYVPRTEYKSVPNGKLSLRIHSYHPRLRRQTWTDGDRQRLEHCLGSFLAAVTAIPERERLERLEAARREIEMEQRRRAEEEREQQEALEERQRVLEAARIQDLDARLDDWAKARGIDELTAAIERDARDRREPLDSESETGKWLAWARARAQRLQRRAVRRPGSEPEP